MGLVIFLAVFFFLIGAITAVIQGISRVVKTVTAHPQTGLAARRGIQVLVSTGVALASASLLSPLVAGAFTYQQTAVGCFAAAWIILYPHFNP